MIQLIEACKELKGKPILCNITHDFREGTVTLLRGHNGCGKTMLLRLLCGLIRPTSGQVTADKEHTFGVMIENIAFLAYENAAYNLRYLANIRKTIGEEEIDEWLKKVNLFDVRKKKVRTFSLGMKQRLGICQAFMESPDVLLLDEPFNALDSENARMVCGLIQDAVDAGKIVVVAAHGELPEKFKFDTVIQMENGKMISSTDNR
ncbi:MAG: ABC transporter ATP-binding protein [Oscillospiraceae bacterium]|jgi:ABC-2 type transport system ATP-binding protein|nr:ABC transporter ATP-binding protein [Oscillospiraceae bacterium]